MFLRYTNRKKDGKGHRYFSIVENRRVPDGQAVQRTVLYLGEINDQQQRLPQGREDVSWEKVLQLLVMNRLLEPGSEFHLPRQWFVGSAMDELLDTGFAVAGCIAVWTAS